MIQISAELLALSSEPALLSRNGKVLFANAAACRLLGQDCTGKPLHAVLGKEIASVQASSFVGEVVVAGQKLLLRVNSCDGTRAFFLSVCQPVDEGVNDAFLFYLRSSLMDINLSLSVLRTRLEAARNTEPLETVRALSRSFFRLNRVLINATVVRDVEGNDICFQPQPTDLSALLHAVADSVSLYFPAFSLQVQAPESLVIPADSTLLRCLLFNLISNCIRHADGCQNISLNLRDTGERVLLSVSDDGRGIPPEAMPYVFERYRHGFELKDAGAGVGLGLTASREIAHLHGGTLLLESREGLGTAVRVSLSKNPRPIHPLLEARHAYVSELDDLTTGLADCLPDYCFGEQFMD